MLHLVEDAEQALARIHALLKPGGLLISATPAWEAAVGSALLALGGKTGLINPRAAVHERRVGDFVACAGFEIAETRAWTLAPGRFHRRQKRERV